MADAKVGIALTVSGAAQAQRDLTLVESSLSRLQTFAAGAGKLLGGIGAAYVTREILQAFGQIVSGMEDIYEASQKVGLSTEALSGLKYAAQQSGVSFEQLTGGLVKFSRAVNEARTGNKELAQILGQIGVAAGDNVDQALAKVADQFARMPDGIQKTALATQLFGKAGAELIPFLNEGADGIAALREEAARLGVVLDSEAAAAADRFGDNVDSLKAAVEGVAIALTSDMLVALVDITNAMAIAAKQGEGFIGVMSAMASAAERLMYFGSGIGGVDSALSEAEAKLREMEGLADSYRRIRDGLEQESLTSSLRRNITGTSITEQIEAFESEAAKARDAVSSLRGELVDYAASEEKAARAAERRSDAVQITVTATDKQTAATKRSSGATDHAAKAAEREAAALQKLYEAEALRYVKLTQSAEVAYDFQLALEGIEAADRGFLVAQKLSNDELEKTQKAIKDTAEETGVFQEVVEDAARGMRSAFSDFFYDMLMDGQKAFQDFGDTIKKLFARLLSDLMSAALANPIRILLTGTGGVAGAAASGTASASGGGMLDSFGSTIGSGIGSMLFNGMPAGIMGTMGNLLSFGSAGLMSGTGSGMAAGLGALGMAAAPLAAVAALSYALKDRNPDEEWFRIYSGSRTGRDAVSPLTKATTAFGDVGVSGWEDLSGETQAQFSQQVTDTLVSLDNAIAGVLTSSAIEGAKAALAGSVAYSPQFGGDASLSSDQATAKVIKERYVRLFSGIDQALADEVAAAANSTEAVGGVINSIVTRLGREKARTDLNTSVGGQILAITDPFAAALQSLDAEFATVRATALDLGADLVQIETLYQLRRTAILDQQATEQERIARESAAEQARIAAEAAAEQARIAAEAAAEQARLTASLEDLNVRRLQAMAGISGLGADADIATAEARRLATERELAAAMTDTERAVLAEIQALEAQADAAVAARSAQEELAAAEREAARVAEETAAAMAEAARQQAQALASLEVRRLGVIATLAGDNLGARYAAEDASTRISRAMELAQAENDIIRARLQEIYALEDAATAMQRAQAQQDDQQAAEQARLDSLAEARDRYIDALQREQDRLEQLAEDFRTMGTSLRDFRQSLLVGDLSILSPGDQLKEARRQFDSISRAAQLGDLRAMGQLEGASQTLLEESRGYYASSTGYVSDFRRVQSALASTETVAERQARIADEQLAVVEQQLVSLGVVEDTVQTLAEAQAAYYDALRQQTAQQGAQHAEVITELSANVRVASAGYTQITTLLSTLDARVASVETALRRAAAA